MSGSLKWVRNCLYPSARRCDRSPLGRGSILGIKSKAKRAAAAGVAVATSGLSSCNDNGAVDPPPPPLECSDVDQGQSLEATAERVERVLSVTVRHVPRPPAADAYWLDVRVTDPQGVVIVSVVTSPNGRQDEVLVTLLLESDTTSTGSFTVEGTLAGYSNQHCDLSRTFTFTIDGQNIVVGQRKGHSLPLAARDRARIVLVGREEREVELEARTAYRGAHGVSWSVTGGHLVTDANRHARWLLPEEAGLYQVQVVVDYGQNGLAVDTMAFEVLG